MDLQYAVSKNTVIPCLSPQILDKRCFCFFLGPLEVPRETAKILCKIWADKQSIMVFSEAAYTRHMQLQLSTEVPEL